MEFSPFFSIKESLTEPTKKPASMQALFTTAQDYFLGACCWAAFIAS
jgi:hypothetical protein